MSEVNGPLGDPRYHAYAASIRESGDYLLSIINDLLDMAKFNAGRTQLAEARVDLAGIVAAVARMIEGRAQHGAIDFHVALEPPTPDLLADERQLKQMLLNLASNAVKFTPPGGEVHIAGVMTEEGGYALTVRDTGIGMAEADIPVALAPFGQIDSSLARGHHGTGLGLPLVKSMIEGHGGRLLLVSRPGKGTTATLLFPARRVLTDRAAPAGEQTAK
ncbi:MAG: HAMP domain-containing sensor histidine kinase [Oceanibaculum nanhaiense]|uniref:sensor histidine kinase n=1 Tax=Oceanibaculum nanhaiense TaxID=1909734 RepID=UPI0025A39118|nr:HAMP domain-containing sensor histidine kinase [Oceanibaculum nanhaiense]MDM7945039.1 HAMP domain-containing sensor histidine kinase [Oceanibaculum nanhaiense]